MAMSTLLEQARQLKATGLSSDYSVDEQIDLAIAWAKGEVSFTQVSKVIKKQTENGRVNSNGTYTFLALGLRQAVTNRQLVEALR